MSTNLSRMFHRIAPALHFRQHFFYTQASESPLIPLLEIAEIYFTQNRLITCSNI